MGRITAGLVKSFRNWERSTQIAFIVAFILFLVAFLLVLIVPITDRQPFLIGTIGSLFAMQLIFMWGNRNMVTSFTAAQRLYLQEDFQSARLLLEKLDEEGKSDVRSLTLLANTYRQLGLLDQSEEFVKKALDFSPFNHFPLYSFGRTLLIKGDYAGAITAIQQALDAGAPQIVRFDLAEALYRAGHVDDAVIILREILNLEQELFRLLMTEYLLYRVAASPAPSPHKIEAGITYWRELSARFQHTPYGQALSADIAVMQDLLEAS